MKVAIIGGGMTGLTAGFRLSQAGHQVFIFEKENQLGGLAAGFKEKNWSWSAENFFHHFFTSDDSARRLISDLSLADKIFYVRPKTSIFKNGKIAQFDSPFSLLTFPFLSSKNDWRALEKVTAQDWLKKFYGQKNYQLLWKPLLAAKFGLFSDQVSMAWFWARIKKRSSRLGYLQGGFQTLIDKLTEEIKNKNGKIIAKTEIKKIVIHDSKFIIRDSSGIHHSKFDTIIVTIPTPDFSKIKSFPADYRKKLSKLEFVSALNLALVLTKKFLIDGTYWLNINEKDFPFVAVVEHTNFVDPKYYAKEHLLYVGGYYPQNHRYFKMTKREIFKEFLPYLKKINPKFHQLSAISYQLSANLYAQPVILRNYSQVMPSMKTPIPNLYLANQSLIYPWDRGVNYAIKLGEEVALRFGGQA
jgi:protoporphyrinogen oxidase